MGPIKEKSMTSVSFEHWRYTFTEEMLFRYGGPFSRGVAGSVFMQDIYHRATKASDMNATISYEQLLCGNEAFPEAAVADPLADLEVWDEWRSGTRYFPYPGRYSKLDITSQDDKTSSPSTVGVLGEIMAGLFAQVGISPCQPSS